MAKRLLELPASAGGFAHPSSAHQATEIPLSLRLTGVAWLSPRLLVCPFHRPLVTCHLLPSTPTRFQVNGSLVLYSLTSPPHPPPLEGTVCAFMSSGQEPWM